ncbi:MAG: EAL domain-containing protein [Xanthobacteraceae bacterium]
MRLAAVFVALCMILIAGSAGAIGFLYFDLNSSQAGMLAAATLAALALYNIAANRLGLRSMVGRQLADLARGHADLSRQVAEMGRRLAAMEEKVGSAVDQTRAVTDPLTIELGELGTLVKRLAETLATQQNTIDAFASGAAAQAAAAEPSPAPNQMDSAAAASALPLKSPPDVVAIRDALDGNRIDLYLQPIVSLPQRKVRFYEALSRMRTVEGEVLSAGEFISVAEGTALMPAIDRLVARRCVQIARRLLSKDREIGLFCNLSAATFADAPSRSDFLDLLDANRALAPSLILEFTLAAVRRMGPLEQEALAALSQRGFRFSVDNVTDFRLDPGDLASRGFRFVKVPASLILKRAPAPLAGIAPAELSNLLGRFGIDLVADRIELEVSVVDLIDADVRYAQGFLFSPPRPVRAEALQPLPECTPGAADASLGTEGASGETDAKGGEGVATVVPESANSG